MGKRNAHGQESTDRGYVLYRAKRGYQNHIGPEGDKA